MEKPVLLIVIASTRPGRVGLPVGRWLQGASERHGKFEVRVADLAEVNLPLLDEPEHPRLRRYRHEHTKRWSAMVEGADAFAFVTPEYNYGPTPALVNALDYLYVEWGYKPAGFCSYGGVSGGIRAVQVTKQMFSAMRLVTVVEAVVLPNVHQQVKEGAFAPTEQNEKAAGAMLEELLRWAAALRPMRATPAR